MIHIKKMLCGTIVLGTLLSTTSLLANDAFINAAKSGDTEVIRSMLDDGAHVDRLSADQTTALMWAIHKRHSDLAIILVEAGADPSITNRYGVTALSMAASTGDDRVTAALLEHGADATHASPEGETVLMSAAKAGNPEVIQLLLAGGSVSEGADPNAVEGWKGQTALMWAAAAGHAEAVRILVDADANVDAQSTAIEVPVVNEDRKQGGFVYPDIPKGRMSAIHFAARQGELETVQALVDAGANLDAQDQEGVNALVLATLNGHLDVAALLLESGANPDIADDWGRTVLLTATDLNTMEAVSRRAPDISGDLSPVDIVKLAVAKGADPDVAVKKLLPRWLAQGAGQNNVINEGATPFMRASLSGDLEIMGILLEAGANPALATAEREGEEYTDLCYVATPSGLTTSLMVAAGVGWRPGITRGRDADAIEAIKLIMSKDPSADINAANQAGDTALHGAVIRGAPMIVEFLLSQGADRTLKNNYGWTALDVAMGQPSCRIPANQAIAALLGGPNSSKSAQEVAAQ
jgi:ankyrin repeat protein